MQLRRFSTASFLRALENASHRFPSKGKALDASQQQALNFAKNIGMTVTEDLIHIPKSVNKIQANHALNWLLTDKPSEQDMQALLRERQKIMATLKTGPAPTPEGPAPKAMAPGKKFG